MAEGGTNAAAAQSGGGWWDNLMSAAKTKSVEVFEFMKKDFDEFSSAVKSEAAIIANTTATAVKETLQLDKEESTASTVKRSVSSFLGTMKEALSPSPSQEFDEALVIHDGNPVKMTKLQRKIHALVLEDATYLEPISDDQRGQFDAWMGVVKETLESVDRLTHLLSVDPKLQDKYTTLVPGKVSHTEFWQRYLFRKAVLEDREAEEERKEERERRQADNYPWHKEESLGAEIDLSEEEQTRLLAEYEQEKNGGGKQQRTPGKKSDGGGGGGEQSKDSLTVREKKDMVIVSQGNNDTSQASSSSKASTDGDWEKEFDIEETEDDKEKEAKKQQE